MEKEDAWRSGLTASLASVREIREVTSSTLPTANRSISNRLIFVSWGKVLMGLTQDKGVNVTLNRSPTVVISYRGALHVKIKQERNK